MYRTLSLLLLLTACGGHPQVTYPPPPTPDAGHQEPMPTQQTYSAKGLWTFPNPLSEVPDGAFQRADNVVIRRPGIVETRRGFQTAPGTFGSSSDRLYQLADFAGTLIGYTTANKVMRYSGGTWTEYNGTFPTTGNLGGRRPRFLQMAKSLYFTTDSGVKRIDEVSGSVFNAGVPQATGGTVTLTGTGWFPANAQTSYRYVWGLKNANDRVILGAPSGRVSLTNPSSGSAQNVQHTIQIPGWVTTDYFLQVYRADTSAGETIPASDDMSLVYEVYPTPAQVTARSLTFIDVTPDALKGQALYSSPNAGIPGSEKFEPPVCSDLAQYKGRMWCSTTIQRQRLLITILSVDASSGGMQDGQNITISSSTPLEVRTFTAGAAENFGTDTFQRYTSGTPSQNIANTAQSLVRVINHNVSSNFKASYVSGEYDNPGQILIEASTLGAGQFMMFTGNAANWLVPATKGVVLTTSVTRAGSTVTVDSVLPHGFMVGQQIELVTSPNNTLFPVGNKIVASVVDADTFTYTEAGTAGTAGLGVFETLAQLTVSDPVNAPNGLAYSEFGEPDAVPLPNYLAVGSANYAIQRILNLGDTLFIFKEDGTWILTGDTPETFSTREFPTPAKIVAPDTAVVLGNSIYVLTDQGVLAFTESGAQIVSRPIEGALLPFYTGGSALRQLVADVGFAVAYETEREYHLYLPEIVGVDWPTESFVYNYATNTWTMWGKAASTGYVLPGADVEYLGKVTSSGGPINAALVERKTRTVADYQDETGIPILAAVEWQIRTGGDPSTYKGWQKVTVMYEQPTLTQFTLGVDTEISPTSSQGAFPTDGLPYISTYIPVEQARSQVLTVIVAGGEAGKLMALTGLTVDFTPSSTKLR